MKITISQELKNKLPNFKVFAYSMEVNINCTLEVESMLNQLTSEFTSKYDITEVVNIPKLKASRDGYKKLGKDPSRYRLATEALIRRLVKGLGLYRINDVVDLGNILSAKTMRSVCCVDMDKIEGDIYIRIGNDDDDYYGINRGHINITNMPVYCDSIGPFGTPTSDTMRTAITEETKNIIVMLIAFDDSDIDVDNKLLISLYENYAKAENIQKIEEIL